LGSQAEISLSGADVPYFPRKQTIIAVWAQTEHVDKIVSALQAKFLRDHLFYVENGQNWRTLFQRRTL